VGAGDGALRVEILLAPNLPAGVLGSLRQMGIEAESDSKASFEQLAERGRRENAIIMVADHAIKNEQGILERAPGVIVLGKGAWGNSGLTAPVRAYLGGFHPERFRRHLSYLYGRGPNLATIRSPHGASMLENISLPRHTREEFLHHREVGMSELNHVGIHLAGFTRTSRGYFVERRPAPFHLLGLVQHGFLEISCQQGQTRRVGAGCCFCLPAGFRGFYRVEKSADFLWFHISKERLGTPPADRLAVCSSYPAMSWIQTARQFLQESRGVSCDRRVALLRLAQLLELQIQRAVGSLGLNQDREGVRSRLLHVMDRVGENLTEAWSVSKLAKETGLSTPQLYRETRARFQKTPAQMVQEIRIRHAAELLLTQEVKLQEVAARTGYGDPFSFSRAFKRMVGSSPSHFRRTDKNDIKMGKKGMEKKKTSVYG